MASIHQINHPGRELFISYKQKDRQQENYYFYQNSSTKGIRLWNRYKINSIDNLHKRKFIEFEGRYISDLNSFKEEKGLLRFWGEYEGYSEFELIDKRKDEDYWNNPYAVHRPFFYNNTNNNMQNTDPFIFGNEFYYAICKKDKLKNIKYGDLILFGSEFGEKDNVKFYLDTLLVIGEEIEVNSANFDDIYNESTINRCTINAPIHKGQRFLDINGRKNSLFSFVPCKPSNKYNLSFGRPIIDTTKYNDYLKKPGAYTGCKSKELKENDTVQNFWNKIASDVINQGFYLGTHFDILPILNALPN